MSEKTVKKGFTKTTKFFLVSLVVLLLCSFLNWGVITSWGKVKVTRLTLVGDNGNKYSALMYVPSNATNETPAPANLMLHGNSGNARNHESWAVEYSRRGYVVLSVDYLGSGDSEYIADNNAVGELFLQYLLELPIVDADNFIISGHSLGCKPAYDLGIKYNIGTLIVCGGVRATIPVDAPDGYGFYGNMLSIIGDSEHMRTYEVENGNTIKSFIANGVDLGPSGEVEYGKVYGSFAQGNAKEAAFSENQTHEGAFISEDNLRYQLAFAQQAIKSPIEISENNQVWMWKDYIGLVSLFVFVVWLIATYLFIMEKSTFFQSIKQPMPRNIGLRGIGLTISIIAAVVFPLIVLFTGAFGLWDVFDLNKLSLFPLQQANRSFVTIIGLNLLGLIMIFVYKFTDGKKAKATLEDYGLTSKGSKKLDWKLIGKSFLLACLVALIGWAYLEIQLNVLGTDFYAWFFGFKSINWTKIQYYLPYIIGWMICFVVTSLGMNVERRLPSTGNETKDLFIAMAFNVTCAAFTVTLMIVIQNQLQLHLGLGTAALSNFKTDFTRIWGMPVGMGLAGIGHTLLYRKTGSIWPGVFLMGIVCALSCVLYGQYRGPYVPPVVK